MKKSEYTLLILLLTVVFYSCSSPNQEIEGDVSGIDVSLMGEATPNEDFYEFANGNWLKTTEIPADESVWGGFGELRKKNVKKVLEILKSSERSGKYDATTDEGKAINFFTVGMDSLKAENMGVKPIEKWMSQIDQVTKDDLFSLFASMNVAGYETFFGVGCFNDLKNSDVNVMYLSPDGIGLPNRDYYEKTDSVSVAIREKYVKHIEAMLTLAQVEGNVAMMAKEAMDIEKKLALSMLTPIEERDLSLIYNPITLSELEKMTPAIDWKMYLSKTGIDQNLLDTFVLMQPNNIKVVDEVVETTTLSKLRSFLKWKIIDRAASFLSGDLVQKNFEFFGKVLNGTKELKSRWERVLGVTNSLIGEAVGKVYVAETFPQEAKKSVLNMVKNLIKAFDSRIRALEWMSEETKQKAIEKLDRMMIKIGYPNKWKSYSNLQVENEGEFYSYLSNLENATAWQFKKEVVEKIRTRVDREEWHMPPQTVNAYFNPVNNEIVFPAAILQPPFYNYRADAAVNYGGMGAVIGHEISHCFDDQGSRFDAYGNMVNWWTEEDDKKFKDRSKRLVDQFNKYEVLKDVFVQGELTLGENIGDLGGVSVAYDALQLYLKQNGTPENIDGFTPEQRFFISWATIWRTKIRDEALRTRILTDPHSPGQIRAIGPLKNLDEFYQAFNIQEGDQMCLPVEERVKIW